MTTRTPIPGSVWRVAFADWRFPGAAEMGIGPLLLGLGFWSVMGINLLVLRSRPFETLLLLAAIHCIACLLHECGHAAASLLLGYQVAGIRIGPLHATRRKKGWGVRLDWKQSIDGGCVMSVPPRRGVSRWQVVAIVAAGPLTHLAALLWVALGWRFWLRVAPDWCVPILLVSAAGLAINLAPRRSGLIVSDGARLLQFLRAEPAAAHCAAYELFGRAYRGELRVSHDPALADLAASCGPYALDRYGGNLLAYGWAAACGDWTRAAAYLDSALAAAEELDLPRGARVFHVVARAHVRRRTGAPPDVRECVRQLHVTSRTDLVGHVLLSLRDRLGPLG